MWQIIRKSVAESDYFKEFNISTLNKIWYKTDPLKNWNNQLDLVKTSLKGLRTEMTKTLPLKDINPDARNFYVDCLKSFYGIPKTCPKDKDFIMSRRRRSESDCVSVVVPEIVKPVSDHARENSASKIRYFGLLLLTLYSLF